MNTTEKGGHKISHLHNTHKRKPEKTCNFQNNKPENKLEAEITSSFQIKTVILLSQRSTIVKSPAFFCQQEGRGRWGKNRSQYIFAFLHLLLKISYEISHLGRGEKRDTLLFFVCFPLAHHPPRQPPPHTQTPKCRHHSGCHNYYTNKRPRMERHQVKLGLDLHPQS